MIHINLQPLACYCYDPTLINFLKFQPIWIISAVFAASAITTDVSKKASLTIIHLGARVSYHARKLFPWRTLSGSAGPNFISRRFTKRISEPRGVVCSKSGEKYILIKITYIMFRQDNLAAKEKGGLPWDALTAT